MIIYCETNFCDDNDAKCETLVCTIFDNVVHNQIPLVE